MIPLEELKYWSVERQEAYAGPEAVLRRLHPPKAPGLRRRALRPLPGSPRREAAACHCGRLTCRPSVDRANFFTLAGLPR